MPAGHLLEEPLARLLLDMQPFMSHKRDVRVTSMVGEALGVPRLFALDAIEECGSLVEVTDGNGSGAAGQDGLKNG